MSAESDAYAATYLRESDRDRYLATLVFDGPARSALTALYAFNADVASVRDRVRDPAAGEIRLQWWADALSGDGHGNVRQNPLADALLEAAAAYGLPTPPLTRLITARRFDLYNDPMPDLPTLEGYAGETASVLYQLAAMILNNGAPVEPGDAAGHLGVAHALIGHLRAFGFNAMQGRLFLPLSIFRANGVAEAAIFAGETSTALGDALEQIAEIAGEHVMKADAAIAALPRHLRPAFAPIAVTRRQLRRADLAQPFLRQSDLADWRKIALLSLYKLRGR